MHTTRGTKEIDASTDEVWAVLDDFGNLQEYSPKNETCELLDGPETGIGARRKSTLTDGSRVVHEIIEYEPEERYTIDFVEGEEFPMKELQIEFSLDSIGEARTEVTMAAHYTPKWGPLGWILAKTVMKWKSRDIIQETLDGLEQHIRTGETIRK